MLTPARARRPFSTAIFDVICPISIFNINCNILKLAPVPQLPGDLALVAGLAGVGGVQLVPHLRARLSLEETLVDNSLTALEWTMMIWLPSAWRTLCTPRKQKPRNVSLSTPDIFLGWKICKIWKIRWNYFREPVKNTLCMSSIHCIPAHKCCTVASPFLF